MKRKLIVLNISLAVLIGAACWQLRKQWLAASQHEQAVIEHITKPGGPLPYTPPAGAQPVVPVQYLDVASKNLFAKDRNPNVVIDVIQPPAPPPPPPMPPLPVVKGILNIGGGVTAIMTEAGKAVQKEIKPGDPIGEFKLLAINNQEIVLEWNGEEIRRPVQELFDRSTPEQAPAAAAQAQASPATNNAPAITAKSGPGADIGAGRKACIPGDASPAGTVVDGMKKISWSTPFGQGCAWEAPNK